MAQISTDMKNKLIYILLGVLAAAILLLIPEKPEVIHIVLAVSALAFSIKHTVEYLYKK